MITSRSTRDQHVDQRDKCCIMLRVLQIQAESVLTTYLLCIDFKLGEIIFRQEITSRHQL